MELEPLVLVLLVTGALVCEYIDSTLGMGYGTTLTPILLLFGFPPLQIIPAILLSELISGLLAGLLHQKEGNVNFKPKVIDLKAVKQLLKENGCYNGIKQILSLHCKIAALLALCSVIGTVIAVFIAVNIPRFYLKLYIGILVLFMGLITLIFLNKDFKFSKLRIFILGLIASFNKGMSGGGYGPVVTSGQILSGVEGKSAVGITSIAEGMTCLVGVIAYALVSSNPVDFRLAPYIVTGAIISVPLSAKSVKYLKTRHLKLAIAVLTIALGTLTLCKTLLG